LTKLLLITINHSQAKPKSVLVGVNLNPILLKGFLLAEMSGYNYTHLFENKALAGERGRGRGYSWGRERGRGGGTLA